MYSFVMEDGNCPCKDLLRSSFHTIWHSYSASTIVFCCPFLLVTIKTKGHIFPIALYMFVLERIFLNGIYWIANFGLRFKKQQILVSSCGIELNLRSPLLYSSRTCSFTKGNHTWSRKFVPELLQKFPLMCCTCKLLCFHVLSSSFQITLLVIHHLKPL